MKLISLDLINFRNYESLHLELDPGVNLIVGNNAQGKTNLLESVVYLSQSASYRTRKEEELIRWNQDFARLEAKIQGQDRETELVYALFRGSRNQRLIPIAGSPVDLTSMPAGCAFASRCDCAMKICLTDLPEELPINEDHRAACWMNVKHVYDEARKEGAAQ